MYFVARAFMWLHVDGTISFAGKLLRFSTKDIVSEHFQLLFPESSQSTGRSTSHCYFMLGWLELSVFSPVQWSFFIYVLLCSSALVTSSYYTKFECVA